MKTVWKVSILSLFVSGSVFAQQFTETPKNDPAAPTKNEATEVSDLKAAFEGVKEAKNLNTVIIVNQPQMIKPVQSSLPIVDRSTVSAPAKSVYFRGSVGTAVTKYGGADSDDIDKIEKAFGDHTVLAFDLGVYVPVSDNNVLIGATFNMVGDIFGDPDEDHYSIYNYILGLSAINYFGATPDNGFYLRGDIGLAWQYSEFYYYDKYNRIQYDISDDSNFGYGYLLGAGHTFGLGRAGIKLEGNLQTSVIQQDGTDYVAHAAALTVGFAF